MRKSKTGYSRGNRVLEFCLGGYKGKNYEFSSKYNWPGFWIKTIELSGTTNDNIDISGLVTNISSDQTKTSVPIIIDLHGHDERRGALSIYGELNYLEEKPRKSFEMKYDGFSLAKSKISLSELLPYE